MKLSARSLLLAATLTACAVTTTFTTRYTEAAVNSTGYYRACFDGVAIREGPDRPARDNLRKGQTFVVTGSVGGNYVFGYKLTNKVHGWVKSSSLDKSCP